MCAMSVKELTIGFVTASISVTAAVVSLAQAPEQYPAKPVQFVVPFGAGGATDTLARVVGQQLSSRLGNVFVVENRPGGNGNIGTMILAKSPPDGYTIGMGAMSTLAINPAIYKKLAYNPKEDLAPVASLVSMPLVLLVNKDIPIKALDELIEYMITNRKSLSYGSPGVGNTSHLFGELFSRSTGVNMVHIPYSSGVAVTTDLIAGRIQVSFTTLLEALPHVRAGSVRPLAIAWSQRSKSLPDLPTLTEFGIAGFESPTWFGVLAPRGTPSNIINLLSDEIKIALAEPKVLAVLDRLAVEPLVMGPQDFGTFILREQQKWGALARESGAQAD
jgi:tripartite-type tricarboxylate transporter receptor subunit TctC